MRNRSLVHTLGRWLPTVAFDELYTPSVADLDRERLERPLSPSRYTLRVITIWMQCLGLSGLDWLKRLVSRRPVGRAPDRKDFVGMFGRDLRHALRLFVREPAFTVVAVVTLTLGIGANTALFAVVEAALLRPLPYSEAERIIVLRHRDVPTGIVKQFLAIGDVLDMRERQQVLESLAPYSRFQSTLFDAAEPTPVEGAAVTPAVFDALRLRLAMGRPFLADDVRERAAPVVIISHELWQSELGSDPNILLRSLQFGSTRRLVVGITPPGFRFPPGERTDALIPFALPTAPPANRKAGWIFAMGRLKDGETMDRAQVEFERLSQQMADEHPEQNRGTVYEALTLRETVVGDTRTPLLLLLTAVGCVLLIACANVGNLLLARALARRQEFSMRLALGASRARLVSQILTESLVLASIGGVVGTLAAWYLAPALAAMVPQSTPIPGLDSVRINSWVLAFSLGVSVLSALFFSGIAIVGLARDARAASTATRRTSETAGVRRAAASLVAAEIALAVVLLMGAGLTLRSFANLMSVDPGFRADDVLTVQFALPAGRYPDAAARRALFDRLFGALEQLPEVETVGAAAVTPLTGNNWIVTLDRPDRPLPAGQRPPEVGWQAASRGYFQTLNIPLRSGRLFDARDVPGGSPVVIISDVLAQRHFAGEDPIGKRVRIGADATAEIVGVVGSIRRATLADAPREDMYFPFEQGASPSVTLFVRTAGDPRLALPAIRTTIREVERNAVLNQTRPLEQIAAESAGLTRLAMRLLGGFAAIALALAAVGIYGVMSYSVSRRTRELGTRVALGASRADIILLVVRQAAVFAALGLAAGLGIGLAGARALSALLFGVPSWDPLVLASACAVLVAVAGAATYLPARRAASVNPACTLASE